MSKESVVLRLEFYAQIVSCLKIMLGPISVGVKVIAIEIVIRIDTAALGLFRLPRSPLLLLPRRHGRGMQRTSRLETRRQQAWWSRHVLREGESPRVWDIRVLVSGFKNEWRER